MIKSLRRLSVIKVVSLVFILALLFIPTQIVRADESLCTKTPGAPNVKIYRLFKPDANEHLFTPELKEVNMLVSAHGWNYEGIAWYAPRIGDPVYRLYSPVTHHHLYTTSQAEKDTLTQKNGWTADADGQPFFYSGGDIPVYRLYNNAVQMHLITKDINEYELLAKRGWTQEGVQMSATGRVTSQEYPIGPNDISNVPSEYSIQADINLSGTGTGNHAKLVAKTPTSAISFGLQYDDNGMSQYRDATSFIIENVHSNDKGGQEYTRTSYGAKNKTFRVLLALHKNGVCDLYINGNKITSVTNPELANQRITLTVEGCGKVTGDTVLASFDNIEVKKNGVYDPNRKWLTDVIDTNQGIHSDVSAYPTEKRVIISGVIRGIQGDWDSDYGVVSGTVNFE